VRDLFEGKGLVRPAACSIEVSPDALRFWKPTCNFRIYTFEKVKSASLKASVRPGDQLLSQGPMKGVVDY